VVLQLTLEGSAFIEDALGRRMVRPGQAFIHTIPGPFNYGYAAEVPGPYKLVYVSLLGQESFRWARAITHTYGHVLELGLNSPVQTMMMAMAHQPRHHPRHAHSQDRYRVSGQIYQLFMAVLSQLSQSRLHQSPRIGDAVSLIHQQATDPSFNVTALARQMGCSREYLCRQFQHALGVSPSQALTQRRLDMACGLLRQTSEKLENVATACGFSSANYFCRTFRQHFGVTPNTCRIQPEMILKQHSRK
jgi:AraC-like DNA-binding protein